MTDLYIQSDGRDMTVWHDDQALLTEKEAGPVLWAHLVATLPTRDEPQDEPTDPGVRVVDTTQGEWARVGQKWVSESGGVLQWEALNEVYGPLEVIQPATDAEPKTRPFNPGDHVKIIDRTRYGLIRRGRVVVNACSQRPVGPDERVVKIPCFPPEFHVAKIADLTHADADGERP